MLALIYYLFFFFNDTATTEIYTLSLHDALPISIWRERSWSRWAIVVFWIAQLAAAVGFGWAAAGMTGRSEEHTSELQSQSNLVCRLLLEKKKTTISQSNAVHRALSVRHMSYSSL